MIEAKIIKDSTGPMGYRLISIQTKAPKFLDAEIEKHRMISSNSSSSRAIPLAKTLNVEPYIPEDVRINEPGMQGYTSLGEDDYSDWICELKDLHKIIASYVGEWSEYFNIHKQHLNRYLEPFSMQYKIMTANIEVWEYFLNLRDSANADPAIQSLARKIKAAIHNSSPQKLEFGEWHLPYVDSKRSDDREVSAARCARVSYKTHDGEAPAYVEDIKLYNFLVTENHLTPMEHQATPHSPWSNVSFNGYKKEGHNYSGNLMEWEQHRQERLC